MAQAGIEQLDTVARGRSDRITAAELEDQLLEIADPLRDENLPIDLLDLAEPTDQEVAECERIFVAYLRLVAMASVRLRKCIYDHNRAFAQRSIWQRDKLLEIGELGRYDQELKEAWERFFLPAGEEDAVREEECCAWPVSASSTWTAATCLPSVATCAQGCVARGSLHVIADRLEMAGILTGCITCAIA